MNNKLIMTELRLLPWLIDIFVSLIAWFGFLWLFISGLMKTIEIYNESGMVLFEKLLTEQFSTLFLYLFMIFFNALILITWGLYNRWRYRVERRRSAPNLKNMELLKSFNISDEIFAALQKGKVINISNDIDGRIDFVEAYSLTGPNIIPFATKAARAEEEHYSLAIVSNNKSSLL